MPLQYINSALVSAQNRQRFYAHNIPNVPQPNDRGIMLQNILESGLCWQDKSFAYTTRCVGACIKDTLSKKRHTMVAEPATNQDKKGYEITNKVVQIKDKPYSINLPDGYYTFRKLSIKEACRLQGMPDWWFDDASGNKIICETQCYKGLGNGWQLDTVKHIMSYLPIDKSEQIICLSMFDGIGTGRRILEELGYKNIRYIASEIDPYCVKVTSYRYPSIVHIGDAFQVRNDDWHLPVQ